MTNYPQRNEYMSGKVTFEEFYRSVAKAAHISYEGSTILPKIKLALMKGDEHLNTIPLQSWDMMAMATQHILAPAFKLHGDCYSLAGGVCVHKQAAKDAAVSEPEPKEV